MRGGALIYRGLQVATMVWFAALSATPSPPAHADVLRVGASVSDILPDHPQFLAGYGPDRTSTGYLDPLTLRAAVFDDGTTPIVLITLDSIGLTRPDVLDIQSAVAKQLTIPDAQIVVSSTHTHAAPDVVGIWGPRLWRSGRDLEYLKQLINTANDAVATAWQQRVPVSTYAATREVALNWVENVSEPELLDHTLTTVYFNAADGQTVLSLTNYACHPTVLGPDNTLMSADYVSGFYQAMSDARPGVHLFLQGAIGGWVQPLQGDRTHQLAVAHGTDLARASLTTMQSATKVAFTPTRFVSQSFDVPLENWGFRLLLWLGTLERATYDGAMRTSAASFTLSGIEFVTHPGETSPYYSLASRKLMPSQHKIVMGLTQDAMGYILKPDYFEDEDAYPHASYLTSVSVGAEAGPILMQTLERLIRSNR